MKKIIYSLIVLAVIAVLAGCTGEAPTSQSGYANPTALVEAGWLAENIDSKNVKIIAAHALKDSYEFDGHIPGAVYLDYKTDIVDENNPTPNQMAPREKVEALLRRLGIKNKDTLVVYDDTNNMIAARVYNVLKFYGHSDVRLLNGGKKAWTKAGGDLTTEKTAVTASDYTARDKPAKSYVNLEYVYNNLNNPEVQIVDVRPTDQYTGENVRPGIGRDGGHIPGAINAPGGMTWNDDKTIKSPEELKALYAERGVPMDKKIVVYCHNGMLASYSWYVLTELVGYPDVAIYDGSSLEWTNHPDTPLVKGAGPGTPAADLPPL